jgi:hypothetical protein
MNAVFALRGAMRVHRFCANNALTRPCVVIQVQAPAVLDLLPRMFGRDRLISALRK